MDDDSLRLNLIDKPVWLDYQLTQTWVRTIGEGTSALAQLGEGIASVADPLDKRSCEGRRVACDVLNCFD